MFCSKSKRKILKRAGFCLKCKARLAASKCIEQLSEEQRLIVLAYYYDGMSINEIAEVFGTSENLIKSRLILIQKRLMTRFSEEAKKHGCEFCATKIHVLAQILDDIIEI